MNGFGIALLTVAILLANAALGLWLRPRLPIRHRGNDTLDFVRLGTSVIVTVASVVLSLLTYSVKSNFDSSEANSRRYASALILLDQSLRDYGPEADPARALLQRYTTQALRTTWPEEYGDASGAIEIEGVGLGALLFQLQGIVRHFAPSNPLQTAIAGECRADAQQVLSQRYALIEQMHHSIPPLMLWGLIAWFAIIFLGFGLNAPNNLLVTITIFASAAVVSSAVFLIVEMDTPLNGVIKLSSQPLRDALAHELAATSTPVGLR